RERRRISVGEIVRVVRTLETAEDPYQDIPASDLGKQVIRPMWGDLQEEIMQRLDAITVDDLCMRAYRGGITSEVEKKLDFTI
ncbi:MAG: transcriptional regulator, partial [Alphaproteobacteria bacterium]|nr:transcriptional regulator [Alphaproteobacteria bacterium]